jgi:MoaD family protein
MNVQVQFYSYFKELTGVDAVEVNLASGSTVGDLLRELHQRFPGLKKMERSTLIAVGLEYQNQSYVLNEGDQVAFFPPVQGG